MRNRADAETRLKMELEQWFIKQCKNSFEDYYLYYMEATAEHDGGLLIYQDQPPNTGYKLACPERINKGATIEQNFNHLRNQILGKLPILSV